MLKIEIQILNENTIFLVFPQRVRVIIKCASAYIFYSLNSFLTHKNIFATLKIAGELVGL